jgi:hypothetical protein
MRRPDPGALWSGDDLGDQEWAHGKTYVPLLHSRPRKTEITNGWDARKAPGDRRNDLSDLI